MRKQCACSSRAVAAGQLREGLLVAGAHGRDQRVERRGGHREPNVGPRTRATSGSCPILHPEIRPGPACGSLSGSTITSPPRSGVTTSALRRARSGSAGARDGATARDAARSTARISISANGAPAQRRTPPPNGIQAAGSGGGLASQRSGRKAAACGHRSSRRSESHRQAVTWTPAGSVQPPMRAGSSEPARRDRQRRAHAQHLLHDRVEIGRARRRAGAPGPPGWRASRSNAQASDADEVSWPAASSATS